MKVGVNAYVGANTKEFTTKMQQMRATMRNTFDSIKPYALAIGAGVVAIGTAAVKAAADMEVLRNRLITAFQGNEGAAKQAMGVINEFTAKTPFQLEQVASAFIKLKNMGLDASMDSLKSYGNTASAMGKSLDQMIEAVADAAVLEFERLKEFGIKAKQQGDTVTFTFRGVSTTVKKNSEEIQQYLLNIGNTDFAGAMEKQSQTLSGLVSTMKDNFKLLAAELGQILLPAIKEMVTWLTKLAERFGGLRRVTEKIESSQMMDVEAMYKKIELLEKKLNRMGRRGTKAGDAIEAEIANLREAIVVAQKFANIKEKFAKPEPVVKPSAAPSQTRISPRGGLIGEMESLAMSSSIFGDRIAAGLTELPEKLNAAKQGFIELGRIIDEDINRNIEQMNMMLEGFVEDTIGQFADAIGAAFAGSGFENFGQDILANLGNFLGQFGKMLIAYGVSISAFHKAITNPGVAIAAGAALVAIAGGIRQHLNNSGQALTSGASASGGTQRVEITGVVRAGDLVYITDRYNSRRR